MRFIGRVYAVYHYPLKNAVRLHFCFYFCFGAVRSLWACRSFLCCAVWCAPAPASGALSFAAIFHAPASPHVPRRRFPAGRRGVARLLRFGARRAGGEFPANLRPAPPLRKLRNPPRRVCPPSRGGAPLWGLAFLPAGVSSLCPAGWCWLGCGRLCCALLGCAGCVAR